MPSSSRPFSTASPVHPNYLPTLHKSSRMEKRLAAATLAAMGVGYGISAYRQNQSMHHQTTTDDYATSSSSSSARGGYAQQQKRREMALLDAYGDRGTLEELEAAVSAYALQQEQMKKK